MEDKMGDEIVKLRMVFYGFFFFLLGILSRHVCTTLKVKMLYYALLYTLGAIIGFLSKKIEHMQNPILSYCGPNCIYALYMPLYLFEMGFLVEANDMKPKIFAFTFLILLPKWLIAATLITVLGVYLFPENLTWQSYVFLVLLSTTPDVHAIRMFFKDRHNCVDQSVVTLLEFESIMAAILVSLIFYTFVKDQDSSGTLLSMPIAITFTFLFGFFMGKMVTFWVKNIHNDMVTQTTVTVASLFMSFCIAKVSGLVPGLAILVVSIVIMRAKPSIAGKSIEFLYSFIEIFRFAFFTLMIVVAGMELVTKLWPLISVRAISVSVLFYFVFFAVRFLALLGAWPLYGRYCFKTLYHVLVLWVCNIRGPLNVVLSFIVTLDPQVFPWASNTLFLLASFQIVLSYSITMPAASFMLISVGKKGFDYEKLAMIFRCANVLKEVRTSFIDVVRKMSFTADADWDVVTQRTQIKKRFLKNNYNKHLLLESLPRFSEFVDKRIRRDTIRLLLRLQRHYLGEQFEEGLVTSHTAKELTIAIMNSYSYKLLMTSDKVLETTAPRNYLLVVHDELVQELNENYSNAGNQALWVFLMFNLFVYTWRLQAISFSYSENFDLPLLLIWGYNLAFTLALLMCFCMAVIKRQRNTWNWLLLTTALLSLFEILNDFLTHQIDWELRRVVWDIYNFNYSNHRHRTFITYLEIGLWTTSLLFRIIVIAYRLPIVKKCLVRLVYSLLAKATYRQCEALLSFMHITKDSLHQLSDLNLHSSLTRGIQTILHQQKLSSKQTIGIMEILLPNILAALKTYIAARLILNSQLHMVRKLRDDGFLEDPDTTLLFDTIQEKIRRLNHFPVTLEEVSGKKLFENLVSLKGDNVKANTLQKLGILRQYKAGDFMLKQTQHPHGLSVILRGLVRTQCDTIITMYSDVAPMTPVYYTNKGASNILRHKIELNNFYSTGTLFGERAILTGKSGHKSIRCVTDVEVLFLPTGVVHEFMGGRPHWDGPMSSLEKNMWRTIAIRYAGRMIQAGISADYLLTCRKVYHMIERSQVIFGHSATTLKLNFRQYQAVILVYGSVWDKDKEHHYVGPCFIPSRISQLELVVGSWQRTVLLVLPEDRGGEHEDMEWNFLRPRELGMGGQTEDLEEMTVSSNSSDGIPHNRYRDSLITEEGNSIADTDFSLQ